MTTSPWGFGLDKELRMVDEKLRDMVKSEEELLTEAAMHVIAAGGKRLRPTVTILSYKALGGTDIEKIIDIAVGFELIHSATLVHDDINDGGSTRRGRTAVYKKFGLHNAVVTGDFMFVKAFALGGTYDKNVVTTTADACQKLAEGEILQSSYRHTAGITLDKYLQVMRRKTAEPIKAGAMVGAYLAGGKPEEIQSMGDYGLNLGIAFQIVDDILDFTGDERKTGKSIGTDIKEGYLTLPSLLAIKDSEDSAKVIRSAITKQELTSEDVRRCVEVVLKSGAIEKAKGMGEYYGNEALQHLGSLSNTPYSQSLRELVRKVLDRDS